MSKFRRLVAAVTVSALLALVATLATVLPSNASSHREAPLISQDPVADNTDTYAFVSPDNPKMVTFVANWIPLEEPAGGPNFYKLGDDVKYTINIDNNGDAVDDIVYEFRFQTRVLHSNTFLYNTGPITDIHDTTYNMRQYYSVARVVHGARTILRSGLLEPPVNIGPRSTPNYAHLADQAIYGLGDGSRVFVGQRDDPFFVDLGSVFDLLGLRPLNPAHVIPLPAARGRDGLYGYNTHSVVLQVPINRLTSDGNWVKSPKAADAVIGVYSTSLRRRNIVLNGDGTVSESGGWVQVSRLGNPLVNEVIIPLSKKDKFNASDPVDDAQFLRYVKNPEPGRLIPFLYPGVKVPPAPRSDLVTIFLTGIPGLNQPPHVHPAELLRLNMGVPPTPFAQQKRLGLLAGQLDGFPNGRRLGDDVTDIELRALAGGTPFTPSFNKFPNNALTDGVNANDKAFSPTFPYVATPWQGYAEPHSP